MNAHAAQRPRIEPVARFYRLVPEAPLPMRADRSAAGILPTRAFRYCDAMTSAAGFGWYLFPPTTIRLLWDGTSMLWSHGEDERWLPLTVAQYPDFRQYFDRRVPSDIAGFSPPFIGTFNEPGVLQIWSGYAVRTAPGWSVLVRPMANFPRPPGYELFEGIIETDAWFGPLFGNVRVTRTGSPVEIRRDLPLFHVQPIPQYVYGDETLNAFEVVPDLASFEAADWERYRDTVVSPSADPERGRGDYARMVRKRRKGSCPFTSDEAG